MLHKQQKKTSGFLDAFKEIVILVTIVFLVRTFGFGLYQVPTGSMETTMLIGERFFADKFTILFSKPVRGDIISFNDPLFPYATNPLIRTYQEYVGIFSGPTNWGPMNWTKRVIGQPGDVVEGKIEDGKPVVYVNGQKLDQPYVNQYPLLAVWADDPAVLYEKAVQEAFSYVHGHAHTREAVEELAARIMAGQRKWFPYDDQVPLDKQPFHRIHPGRIVRAPAGYQEPGVTVTADGKLLKESHVPVGLEEARMHGGGEMKRQGDSYWNGTDEFKITLNDHQYWLMGDNRRGSHDCRVFGPIDVHLIHGKIIFRIWSLDSASDAWLDSWWIIDLIKHPVDFWSRLRGSRFFQVVR